MPKSIYDGHTSRGDCVRALLDRWSGGTLFDIAHEVSGVLYSDEDDYEPEEIDEVLLAPPLEGEPVPKDLLDPQCLVDVLRKIEVDAYEAGNEARAVAAGTAVEALRSGPLLQAASALVDQIEAVGASL